MSREIKFRAFDKRDKKMIFVGFHVFGETTLLHGIETYCYETRDERDSYTRMIEDIEVMQFTGLRDDLGVELFEGDVIEFDCEEMGTEKGVVRFADGGFWTSQPKGMDEQLLSDELHQLKNKKIGDVYSNPELLTP